MAKQTKLDQMVNIVYAQCTQSAADTLTFQKFETGFGTLDKTAWVINRLEYFLPTWPTLTNLDSFQLAITSSNILSDLSLGSAAVKHLAVIREVLASAVGFWVDQEPYVKDFSTLPGGGLIVLPNPLYFAVDSDGLDAALTAQVRLYFEKIEMTDQLWMELVEQTRLLS